MLEFIKEFRGKYGTQFFLNGGCYIFARILQIRFGGVIYSNSDHCVLKILNQYRDISGVVEGEYLPIDELEEKRYKNYENFAL